MTAVKPFGNINKATIMVIGHDPRLQRSGAQAEYVFFMEYLLNYDIPPTYGPDRSKYGLAKGVVDYIGDLAGFQIPLEKLYLTNLCNEFLPSTHGKGTILLPEEEVRKGFKDIFSAIKQGHFKVIIPTSCQVFYRLCRLGFLDEKDERIDLFIMNASPNISKQEQGVYVPKGTAPFLEVCGELFHHDGIPVVPVLYVKQWPIKERMIRFTKPMEKAKQTLGNILK
jgi:hypothetical protein